MLIVNIAFYIIAIVALVLGILGLIKTSQINKNKTTSEKNKTTSEKNKSAIAALEAKCIQQGDGVSLTSPVQGDCRGLQRGINVAKSSTYPDGLIQSPWGASQTPWKPSNAKIAGPGKKVGPGVYSYDMLVNANHIGIHGGGCGGNTSKPRVDASTWVIKKKT